MTVFSTHKAHQLPGRSYSPLVKRDVNSKAKELGFSGGRLGELDIIVSEMLSNLLKHSEPNGRQLLVREIKEKERRGLELISIDNGPGMADMAGMMRDGASTSSTLGQGLGAIRRLSDEFDLYSMPGWGTILLSRIFNKKNMPAPKVSPHMPSLHVVCVPKEGEELSGDGYGFKQNGPLMRLLAMDGLGHGPGAYEAAQAGIRSFLASTAQSPVEILGHMHHDIRRTRGGVAGILEYNRAGRALVYCGVGNITAKLYSGKLNKGLISYNGIVGMNRTSTMNNQTIAIKEPFMAIMASDGLKSQWDISKYPNMHTHDPTMLAATLYKDFARGTDDALVCVMCLK